MTVWPGSLVPDVTENPPPDFIRRMAAVGFGVTVPDLEGLSRERPLVEYRQITMTVVRRLCRMSYPQIGRLFGNRDHTTVMHAVTKIEGGRHHPPHTHPRRLWESAGTLTQEVRRQWAIDTGTTLPPIRDYADEYTPVFPPAEVDVVVFS